MKPAAWFGIVVILASMAFGASAFVRSLTPYVTFADARQSKAPVQVMGKLDKDSIATTPGHLSFVIVDDKGDRMPVTFTQTPPASFKMATEVTAQGSFDGQGIRASNLLVKCPSKYQGKETTQSYSADKTT